MNKIKIGDLVRSIQYGSVGYLHHINDRARAWVADYPNGSNGQYFLLDDLIPFEESF